MPNIIMADAKGQSYDIVSLPNSITNGLELKNTVNDMGLPGRAILVTTRHLSEMLNKNCTCVFLSATGNASNAYRWNQATQNSEQKDMTSSWDFIESEGSTYFVIPCPQT